MPSRSLTLVLLGDTHTLHRELDMPAGDILIHTGEWTMWGRSVSAATDFDLWLAELPYRHRIAVRGNHESYIETDPSQRSMLSNAITLVNESATVEGLKIWGSPVTQHGPAFAMTLDDRRRLYATIPTNTDIIVTHGPL